MSDALFARSTATELLIDLLLSCKEGEVVTYATMTRTTNRDIQRRDRHLLTTALNNARNVGAVFAAITRIGVQRMAPAEVQHEGRRRLKRISNAARRGGKLLDAVQPERLTAEERLGHASTRGIFASVEVAAKPTRATQSGVASRDPVVRMVGP